MDEELIELRRSRARRKPTKRARAEKRSEIIAGIITALMILLFFVLIIFRMATEPAYAYEMPEPVYTVDDSRPIVDYERLIVESPKRLYDKSVTQMSEQEYDELTRIVNLESHTEDMIGQMAVVEVVFNRTQTKGFKNTIHGVLSQKGQFTTWKMRNKAKVTQMQIDAIEAVIAEEESILAPYVEEGKRIGTVDKRAVPTDYVFFCTPEAYEKVGIRYMFNPIKVGGHIFATKYIGKEE